MSNSIKCVFAGVHILAASTSIALSHEILWSNGASRTVGFGHCAKGPCMKRYSFASSVPHRHVGNGRCEGKGAGGYSFGGRFDC